MLAPLTWAAGTVRALPWVAKGVETLAGARRGQLLVALRSVGITVGLLLVFGLLFASADRVFARLMPRVEADLLPGQVVVGVLVAVVAAALAHLALAPPSWSDARLAPRPAAKRGEWLLPVLALDAMVLLFVTVQVGALLGGHRHVLETEGLTYAEYAREGFAQLVVVTALTLVVVAVAARRAPRETPRDRLVSRLALGALCVGTLGVVASALRRMDLYVDAFGLTRLRVFVTVTEIALAAVFVLLLVAGIRWRGGWLPRAVLQVVARGDARPRPGQPGRADRPPQHHGRPGDAPSTPTTSRGCPPTRSRPSTRSRATRRCAGACSRRPASRRPRASATGTSAGNAPRRCWRPSSPTPTRGARRTGDPRSDEDGLLLLDGRGASRPCGQGHQAEHDERDDEHPDHVRGGEPVGQDERERGQGDHHDADRGCAAGRATRRPVRC